jgi:hypothetical protein
VTLEALRPHLRGALIALALLAHGIYAIPLPPAISEEDLQDEWRQRDIAMWQSWLSSVGVSVTTDQLGEGLTRATALTARIDKTLKLPFKHAFQLTGSNQAWALFASATTKPERLVVEIKRQGSTEWEPVQRRLDPCCEWREDQFRYRRIRGIWDGNKERPKAAYRHLSKWIARQAFVDFPDAERVRLYLERRHSTYPWEPDDPKVEMRHQRQHTRDKLE